MSETKMHSQKILLQLNESTSSGLRQAKLLEKRQLAK